MMMMVIIIIMIIMIILIMLLRTYPSPEAKDPSQYGDQFLDRPDHLIPKAIHMLDYIGKYWNTLEYIGIYWTGQTTCLQKL